MFTAESPILPIFLVILTLKDINQDVSEPETFDVLTFIHLDVWVAFLGLCNTFVFSHREFITTVSTVTEFYTLPGTIFATLRSSLKCSFKAFIFLFFE